jgi:dienelactone hydrolase
LDLQEWWGVNDTIKEHAIYLSEQLSARCLIPDLYKGTVGVTVEEAQHSMENLDFPGAVKELTGELHPNPPLSVIQSWPLAFTLRHN